MTNHIDKSALQAITSLQRPGKPDLLGRVVDLFAKDSPAAISAIVAAVETGNLEEIRVAAHSMKSSSAYLGANRLSEQCKNIEQAARNGSELECMAYCEGIEDEFEGALAELQQIVEKAA
jgi:HPt (histidine-containing phosphotransfer) domain-containing protein